ncbi:hypothetical protein SynA1524_00403 [Synechococcus sp. A15-24]|nr:hypothetical protein SynA1524_00403 [Synechococcus sp. A15-24]
MTVIVTDTDGAWRMADVIYLGRWRCQKPKGSNVVTRG